jgi:diguanylate cyclase (GGDEF)-like protein
MKTLHSPPVLRLRRGRLRTPVVRAALFVFVLAGALLAAIVFTLNRNASRTNAQQAATELASGSRVAASAFAAMRSDLRAQAGELATSLDLQRAIVANDRAAIRRIATAHHALIQARGAKTGTLLAAPRITSTATIAQGAQVLARVTLALPLDKTLLALMHEATPLPSHAALVLIRKGRVVAGGPIGSTAIVAHGRVVFGSTPFNAAAAPLGVGGASVLAIEPVSAVEARGVSYRRRLLIAAVLTLALVAGLATRLGRPLARMFGELTDQAERDSLTGLANRRVLDERLEEELDRSRRYGTHLALILVDIDNFKSVNDRYGHQCGDEVLRAVAPVLSGSLRELDLAGRFGGEEFALVLPGTAAVSARRIAEQIRRALAKVTVVGPGGELVGVTASFGAAEFPANASVASLIEAADRALYQAKRGGKDRVVVDGAVVAAAAAQERTVVTPA